MIASANLKAAQAALEVAQQDQTAYRKAHNEGGEGFNPFDSAVSAALTEVINARDADLLANIDSVRAAWNAEVVKYGQAAFKNLKRIEKAVGVTYNEMQWLKTQIA